MKTCSSCNVVKALTGFHRNRKSGDGHSSRCKECALAVVRRWREEHPTYHRDYERTRRVRPPEHAAKHRRYLRDYGLRKYGLDTVGFDALVLAQGGLCALCGLPIGETWGNKASVDHDHATGEVRGVLHMNCNAALGTVERVGAEPFAAYLRRAARARLSVVK